MINKLSKWNPKTLLSIYAWSELLIELCIELVIGLFAILNILMWKIYLFSSINTERLVVNLNSAKLEKVFYISKKIFSLELDVVLILILVGTISFAIKIMTNQAINLSLLRETTVSKFIGPFGFEISKRYLPESSKWRSVLEPSKDARSIHILSRNKK